MLNFKFDEWEGKREKKKWKDRERKRESENEGHFDKLQNEETSVFGTCKMKGVLFMKYSFL
jgi:hypothetical protein